MLIELIYKDSAHYMKAPLPPQHLQDAKFMAVQQRFREALRDMTTARELYEVVPRARPVDRGVFLAQHPTLDGVYKYNHEMFAALPDFDWNILLQLKRDRETRPGPAPLPDTPGNWDEAARIALLPLEEV